MRNNFTVSDARARGFTALELLVYVFISSLVLLAVVAAALYTYRFYRELTIGPRADRVGVSIIERVVRDIRTGSTISLAESTFGVPTGILTITAEDGSGEVEKRVALEEARITYAEDGSAAVNLTPSDITVSRFLLTHLTSAVSEAVRIELELTYVAGGMPRTSTYTGFAILRHSYE